MMARSNRTTTMRRRRPRCFLGLTKYEVWTPLTRYDHVVDVTDVWGEKLAAVRAYRSQLASFNYDRAVTGLNQYRGALAAHCDYAEVFCTLDPND